jgi:mono/diheme cytochrome c family protein
MKILGSLVGLLMGVSYLRGQAPPKSVWDGVYSADQAKRGKTVSGEECARCHAETLTGGENAPALVGDDFIARWKDQTVGDLFEKIRTTMPTDSPGRLGRKEYADVLAFILNSNKFPAGSKELPGDAGPLNQIKITPKPE